MGLLSHAKYDPNRQWEVGIRSSQIKIFKQIVAFWQIFGPKWQRYIAFPLFPLAPHIFFPSFALCTFPAPPFLLCFVPFYVLFLFISSLSPFLSPLYVSSLSLSFISFSFFSLSTCFLMQAFSAWIMQQLCWYWLHCSGPAQGHVWPTSRG